MTTYTSMRLNASLSGKWACHLYLPGLWKYCRTKTLSGQHQTSQETRFIKVSHACCKYGYAFRRHAITTTCLYNFDPLKTHFYIVKLGFTGVYIIFLISAQNHRLWVLVRTSSRRFSRVPTIYVLSRKLKNIRIFYLKVFNFLC